MIPARIILSFLFLLCSSYLFGGFQFVSWNIKDFGKTKDDVEIENIAQLLRNADLVAIQEVVAKDPGGAKAVARLADALSRKGAAWDYIVSDPTKSPSGHISERYAFLWKKSKVKLKSRPYLVDAISSIVHREPYVGVFLIEGKEVTVLNYHSRTYNKENKSEESLEIQTITSWVLRQSFTNIIWAGDFNLPIDHLAFQKIKSAGYSSILHGEKTSLKKSCVNGQYLYDAEDNILFALPSFDPPKGGVLDFMNYFDCEQVGEIRNNISDHLGVVLELN